MKRLSYRLCSTLLFLSFLFSNHSFAIDVVFRIDDYYLNDNALNLQILQAFEEANIPLSIAVVPCDKNENFVYEDSPLTQRIFALALKEKPLVEIALHGLNHSKVQAGEFGKVSYAEQARRLEKGKVFLDSCISSYGANKEVVGFIPPFNAYDETTLQILDSLEFKWISADMYGCFPETTLLRFYPESFGAKYVSPRTVVECVQRHNSEEGLVVVMMHPYDIKLDFTLDSLRACLQEITTIPNVHCYTYSEIIDKHAGTSSWILANKESHLLAKLDERLTVLWPSSVAVFWRGLNAFLYALIGFVICLLSYIMVARSLRSKCLWITLFVLFVLIFTATWFHIIAPLKLLLLVVVIHGVIGGLVAKRYSK